MKAIAFPDKEAARRSFERAAPGYDAAAIVHREVGRRLLEHLAQGDRCVTDLARPYSMSLPAVSKHLRVLEIAGLVRRRRHGRVHRLKLEARPMKQAAQWIEEYRRFWEESFDRLDEYLKGLQAKAKKHEHKDRKK